MKSHSPRATVVIPAFNRAHTLPRAVRSVLTQTFDDFELIVVDDASTDETSRVIGDYDDPRIRYVRNEVNVGGAASRDVGIGLARGDYIAFLDSDDEWLPEFLARIDAAFGSFPNGEVGVAETGYLRPDGSVVLFDGEDAYERLLAFDRHICLSSIAVRKDALGDDLGFGNPTGYAQDRHLFMVVASRYRFVSIREPLVRVHADAGAQMSTPEVMLAKRLHFYSLHAEELASRPRALARHHGALGAVYMQMEDYQQARIEFSEAVKSNPSHPRWWLWWLATLFGRHGVTLIRGGKKLTKGWRALFRRTG